MYIEGTVIDKNTGVPLPGATLTLDGSPIGVTDANGHFAIQTAQSGQSLTISYVGYISNEYPVDAINDMSQIPMTISSDASALPAVTVTPQSAAAASPVQVSNKPNILFPLLLAGGGLFLLAESGKKKRVAGIDTTTILLAGGAAVAVYLLTRPRTPSYVSPVTSPVYNPAYLQAIQNQGNPVAQDITAGGQAATGLSTLVNAFSNL